MAIKIRKSRPLHYRTFVPLIIVAAIAAGAAGYFYLSGKSPSYADTATTFVRALEKNEIKKAISLDRNQSTSNAHYYALLARQMGEDYKLVESRERDTTSGAQSSFIFSTDKPKRPEATFLRIIVGQNKQKKAYIESAFPTPAKPSPFPADIKPKAIEKSSTNKE